MDNIELTNLLDSVLGNGKSTSRGNRAYHCPKCGHHKLKLEINLNSNSPNFQSYQCWVCGFKGKKLKTLFTKLKVDLNKINQLKKITGVKNENTGISKEEYKFVLLPKEFISLINPPSTLIARKALSYLKKRNVSEYDIIKYNIGYCEYGPYSNMIIIPSYNNEGNLNFFVARNFDPNSNIKYSIPDIPRDIIFFELFINWDVPIILCEGVFDAIAIKRNAIPLLGSNIQHNLMKKIINSSVKKIYIALDKDKKAIKKSIEYCEILINEGKEVYLVDFDKKDPSELGFKQFTLNIQNTLPLTFSDILEKKFEII